VSRAPEHEGKRSQGRFAFFKGRTADPKGGGPRYILLCSPMWVWVVTSHLLTKCVFFC